MTLPALLDSFGPRPGMLDDGLEPGNLSSRLGIIWDLRDPAVFKQLFEAMKPFAAGMPFVNLSKNKTSQGYGSPRQPVPRKCRSPAGSSSPQYLVFGMGDGMIEQLLAAVNNPDNGLTQTNSPAACAAVLPPVPGLMQQYGDFGRHYADLMPLMQEMFRGLLQEELDNTLIDLEQLDDPDYSVKEREALEALLAIYDTLFPEQSFWMEAFGVATGYVVTTSDGLLLESATELDRVVTSYLG